MEAILVHLREEGGIQDLDLDPFRVRVLAHHLEEVKRTLQEGKEDVEVILNLVRAPRQGNVDLFPDLVPVHLLAVRMHQQKDLQLLYLLIAFTSRIWSDRLWSRN